MKSSGRAADPKAVWETNSETVIKSTEIELGSEIARGGYGTVFKGKCRGQTVAIKKLHNQHLSGDKLEELKKEVQIQSQLRHPCILLLMGVCTEPDKVALVMEYVDGKSLDRMLHEEKVPLTLHQKFQLAKDIAKGCYWLHCLDPPIIHRDIKPANVLVDTNFRVQICDFGLSCVKEPPGPKKSRVVGSPFWMAPEVLAGHPNTEKSDVFSFAVLLWEIFTGHSPSEGVVDLRGYMFDVVNNNRRPPIPDELANGIKELIRSGWSRYPDQRPTFAEILAKLDDIFVEMVLQEEVAQKLWQSLKDKMGHHYPFFVPWSEFIVSLCKTLNVPVKLEDPGFKSMKALLTEEYKDMTSSKYPDIVNCEKFGDFLGRFGPLVVDAPLPDLISRLRTICECDWFHGDIEVNAAKSRIQGKAPGSFIVRLGSAPQSFTISRVVDDKKNPIIHQRILRKGGLFVVINNETQEIKSFLGLKELVDGVKQDLNLHYPVNQDRVFAPFFRPTAPDNSEYLDTSLLDSMATTSLSAIPLQTKEKEDSGDKAAKDAAAPKKKKKKEKTGETAGSKEKKTKPEKTCDKEEKKKKKSSKKGDDAKPKKEKKEKV
jgi:serine/threonine protein kinase